MIAAAATALIFIFVYYSAGQHALALRAPAFVSGWWLFATLAALVLLNLRKKLPMVPLGRAMWWLLVHLAAGVLAIGIFYIHTGGQWPLGTYEQVLAALFWLTSLSGLLGYLLERLYPRQLVSVGGETIFERVPTEIVRLREAAEAVVVTAAAETGTDTLGQHYLATFAWFFQKPRFLLNHAMFGRRSMHWLRLQCAAVERYLNDEEREQLRHLAALAEEKDRIDAHYVLQGLMRLWLLVHVPLAYALLTLVCWHVIVVHSYLP
jgi:hypothetical protein